jgi:hypothetical protein
VLEISTQLGEFVLSQFMEDGVACPAISQKGLFTTSVADNIFFLSNDVNDEMLMLTCGPLPFDE